MQWLWAAVLTALVAPAAWAEGTAGEFDYYVVALSWSPGWCDRTGYERGSTQCDEDRKLGWMLHGLWPQYAAGWPSSCKTDAQAPSATQALEMADIMGTEELAAYEWRKHGTCSGLSASEYFALSREAFASVVRPEWFRHQKVDQTVTAASIEKRFLQANPQFTADMLTVTCKAGQIQEVRVCMTKDLKPSICSQDVRKDCDLADARLVSIP